MAINIFMQITDPDIPGHTTNLVAPNQFAIASLGFGGVKPSGTSATLTQVTATLGFDSATALFQSMASATTHGVVFRIYQGTATGPAQTITLTNALLTQVQETGTAGDGLPTLEIAWSFQQITIQETDTKIEFEYRNSIG